jgi:hypothetical protein
MFGKDTKLCINAHRLFEGLQEGAIYFFYPKFRFAIGDVECAVLFFFLAFHEEEVFLSSSCKLFIDVVDDI